MPISAKTLKELLNKEETSKLDFKREISLTKTNQKREFVKDICSIANYLFLHSGKGYLIIGYDGDNKQQVGVNKNDYSESIIQQIISSNSDPPPIFSFEYINNNEVTLGVITIQKNYNGPHQVNRMGFPIRRGSITDLLSTDEIYNAMLKRQTYRKSRGNEYEILSGTSKINKIRKDIVNVLSDLDLSEINTINYKGVSGLYYPCKFMCTPLLLDNSEYTLLVSVHSSGNKNDLFRLGYTVDGLLESEKIINPIFINIYSSNVVSGYFNDLLKTHSTLTRIKIKPSITYFGLGIGFSKNRITPNTLYLPKFYISKITSKKNIMNNLEIIINWIKTNKDLIIDIHDFWNI